MLSIFLPLLATLASIPAINAHATFQELWVGSTDEAGSCIRLPFNNSPVTDVTSTDIACNTASAAASPGYCSVAAGGTLTVEMHAQPNDRSCSNDAIGGNHDGPVIIYMAKVDDALTAVGSSAKWFKVAQSGYLGNDYWATDALNANCGKFTFTVPSCLPAGDYLVRAEVIGQPIRPRPLHVAFGLNGAQFYMSCYTVKVTGGGSASPATVSFPGAYSATDPGILFDLYNGFTSYTIPGPAVFTCGSGTGSTSVSSSSSGPSSSTRSSSSTRASSTSTSTRASSTSSTRTSSASGAGQTLYGQCGGQGWTGPTTCAQGTCKVLNPFYSQCT
ncbi:related to family 61 endoglucanase [Serendipita indica DSM 11827]|uniref:AA9 family lytic polysaccharide monooxygenase n=1 Tax=Serendipita indica (strain DSM 11827) TaxID=1109443 RepID=G4TLM9_SERID|nr:related to family 61 endoglucanase [Serendipita indica DSM 11827]